MERVSPAGLVVTLFCLVFPCHAAPLLPGAGQAGLSTPRKQLPWVVLAGGRVLAAGGHDGQRTLASCELYDPETGVWSATGALRTPRRRHAAVVLRDGRVLVVGGSASHGPWGALASAEVYAQEAGQWAPVADMGEARSEPAAVLLADGRVLVAGGFDADGRPVRSAEVYDPQVGQWVPTGAPGAVRSGSGTGVVLEDGRVLFVSGLQAELYEPHTERWGVAGPVGGAAGTHRRGHTLTRLLDGRVLVVGGATARASGTAEVYEPATGLWQLVAPPLMPREGHAAVLEEGGAVLVVGGACPGLGALALVERYEPTSGTWSLGPPLQVARRGAGVVQLPAGELLVAGGANELLGTLASSERHALPRRCVPRTCLGACGEVEDGCGGRLLCEPCVPQSLSEHLAGYLAEHLCGPEGCASLEAVRAPATPWP